LLYLKQTNHKKTTVIFNGIYSPYTYHQQNIDVNPNEIYFVFKITKLIQGNLDFDYIQFEDDNYYMQIYVNEGQEYQFSLALSNDKIKKLGTKHKNLSDYSTVKEEEVVKIIPIKE